jgi:hypothetical protein
MNEIRTEPLSRTQAHNIVGTPLLGSGTASLGTGK